MVASCNYATEYGVSQPITVIARAEGGHDAAEKRVCLCVSCHAPEARQRAS